MNVHRGKIVSGGRLQLPAEMRRELGLVDGDDVILEIKDKELRVRSHRESIRRLQDRFRHLRPTDGTRLSDELIADRRREAERE
jgi:bifunctional DNA-binding transcriptional regulator/antitoxin component of YhaV-PrlF toxin-antitoxin module